MRNSEELEVMLSYVSIIKMTTDIYLEKHLPKIPEDKKHIAIEAYEKDIARIAQFIFDNKFFSEDFILSEAFIKGLHKNLYPQGFTQKGIDENGNEMIWMVPGEYKKIKTYSKAWQDNRLKELIPDWDPNRELYTSPEKTPKEMQKILNSFTCSFYQSKSTIEKKDLIFHFVIDLMYIHPFADGNGRVVSILLDLLLFQAGESPIGLKNTSNTLSLDVSFYMTHHTRDLCYIYNFINKNNCQAKRRSRQFLM